MAGNPRVAFASVHQFPGYPGTGTRSSGNVHNFPIAPFTPRAEHRAAVARALTVLLDFKPDLLLVSAGFDAYAGDPITQMSLEPEDFALFGQWLRESSLPGGRDSRRRLQRRIAATDRRVSRRLDATIRRSLGEKMRSSVFGA